METQGIKLLNKFDVAKMTGWHPDTVRKLFDDEEFPVIKIGKENQVEETALKKYLQTRRVKRGE